jgi:hypothetical protein
MSDLFDASPAGAPRAGVVDETSGAGEVTVRRLAESYGGDPIGAGEGGREGGADRYDYSPRRPADEDPEDEDSEESDDDMDDDDEFDDLDDDDDEDDDEDDDDEDEDDDEDAEFDDDFDDDLVDLDDEYDVDDDDDRLPTRPDPERD